MFTSEGKREEDLMLHCRERRGSEMGGKFECKELDRFEVAGELCSQGDAEVTKGGDTFEGNIRRR